MLRTKLFILFFLLSLINGYSQNTITQLDSLLRKNFKIVNARDTNVYLTIINQAAVFKQKKVLNKKDSIIALKPFKESYGLVIEKLGEMVGDKKFTVSYISYETINQQPITAKTQGKLIIRVKLLVNNKFTVTMPFAIVKTKDVYTIEDSMIVIFNDK